ncbi:uncharacterized protein LOC110031114 [Phalaenopsis equestris]|uniref:uncharacterized protein LOC110031114 n=1 Tax=Phalaenopsis equestris TaxID=78828 RepID=UPI0009E28447|nr:uncharacterized protein LOC110031114 [Phalaenopsis equestris]
MAKFNQIQKARRGRIQDRKRAVHGDPNTRKLKQKVETIPISGKRKRKLFKKWRRDKKAAIEKGLVTMEDIEMEAADGTSQAAKEKSPTKFHLKKASRLRIKKLKSKGKGKKKSSGQSDVAPNDAMVE